MRERAHVLYELRRRMEAEREALAWLVSHENGKVYAQAVAEQQAVFAKLEQARAEASALAERWTELEELRQ